MDCDIHAFVEVRKPKGWVFAGEFTADYKGERVPKCSYSDRNYYLFGILAAVRSALFPRIAEPRGLPRDLAFDTGLNGDDYAGAWLGDHSYSHLSLAEILDYPWHTTAEATGIVSLAEYDRWVSLRKEWCPWRGPESYCAGVGGGKVEVVSEARMVKLLENIKASGAFHYESGCLIPDTPLAKSYYCQIAWDYPASVAAGDFYSYYLPQWRALHSDPNKVRLVFGFDS